MREQVGKGDAGTLESEQEDNPHGGARETHRGQILAEESVPRQGGGEWRYLDDPTRTGYCSRVGNWWGGAREGPIDKGSR